VIAVDIFRGSRDLPLKTLRGGKKRDEFELILGPEMRANGHP
jgi:hypothetical protein